MSNARKLILITGGTGFIGNHTVSKFLSNGYRVRATVRNQDACDRLLSIHWRHRDLLETQIVADITRPGAFDTAVKDVDGIVHMASPFTDKITDNEKDLIVPAINGTKGILRSTVSFAPKVKRVVLTSSFASIADFSKGLRPGHVYEESQWSPLTYQGAKDGNRGLAYAGSKMLAEEAAWQFVETSPGVNFSLATINPNMVYGPAFPGSASLKHLGQSMSDIYALMDASLTEVPPTMLPAYVDVRDVARAHLLAFETDQPQRFLISAGDFDKQKVCDLLRDKICELKSRVPVGNPGKPSVGEHYEVDCSRARSVLGIEFRSFNETFLDMGHAFMEIENAKKESPL
ncbi:SDR family oxidoreductase [Aspergillus alliaceus]|uniref:SDR family oxidoreductase n=1 Tax=Petromyces alliaceus TaxID=209559 RepID=UPI0012A3BBEE|nr:uncharacterized protein BDW43DRAFT_322067 [Aspergillus alliaceus]KAB8229563.1 hypothetical protein BDW43DRAFT_322067 [Aspergillus alliaceus]